jgi:hypothetical protein
MQMTGNMGEVKNGSRYLFHRWLSLLQERLNELDAGIKLELLKGNNDLA